MGMKNYSFDLPVGKTFRIDDKLYKVTKNNGCGGCAFVDSRDCNLDIVLKCQAKTRADDEDVIFVEVES